MLKRNNSRKGVIDPISIIGGLFLVITLIVSAVIVKNRNTSLNINEQAASVPKPIDGEAGINNWVNPKPVVNNPPANTKPVNNNLEEEEVGYIQEVLTAPAVINGTVVNHATSVPVTEEAIGGAPVTNTVVVVPTAAPTTCSANGTTYPENAVIEYGSGTYRKCVGGTLINNCGGTGGAIELCEIADLTVIPTHLQTQYTQATQQQTTVPTEEYVAGPAMQTPRPQTNTATTNNNSSVSTSSTCSPGCPSGQSCVLIGMGYYGCQNTGSLTSYAKEDCGGACATNQTCEQSGDKYVCKTVAYVPYTPQQQSNPCPDGSTYTNGTCVTNQQNITNVENQIAALNQTPSTPVVTTSVQDFINSLTNRFNNVSQSTGMTEIGTYGLGGGNAPVVTPPLSVLTSSDPNALYNFNRGAAISGAGGVVSAATILTGAVAIPSIYSTVNTIGPSAAILYYMSSPLAQLASGLSSTAFAGYTAYGAIDCATGWFGGQACQNAGNMLLSGYLLDPIGTTQMTNQGLKNIFGQFSSPVILGPANLPDEFVDDTATALDNGAINMVWDDASQSFVMEGSTIQNVAQQSELAIIPNQFSLTAPANNNITNALVTNMLLGPINATNNALSVANLNASAVGGGNASNSIPPSYSSYSSGNLSGISGATNPINLQDNGTASKTQTTGPLVFEQDNWELAPDMTSVDPDIRIIFNGDVFTAKSIPEAEEIATRLTGMPTTIPPEAGIIEPALLQIDPQYAGMPPLPAEFGTPSVPNPNSIYYRENYPAGAVANTNSIQIVNQPATIVSSNMRRAGRITKRDVANAVLAVAGINNINSQLVAAAKKVVERYAPNVPITPDFLSYGELPILNLNSDNYYSDLQISEIIKRLDQTSPENYITAIDGITIIPSDSPYTVKLDDIKDVEIPHLSIIIDENGDYFLFVLEDIGNNKVDWTKIPIYENIDTGEFYVDQIIYKLNGPVAQTPKDSPSAITSWIEKIKQQVEDLLPSVFVGGSPAGDPRADEMTFQIGKSHQTDFFDNELDKAVSRNHGEITYNPDDGSLTYLDKDSKNGTWFREEESGEFIKLKKNEPLIITPNTEISPAKGIPFKVVLDNGSISLVDATAFSKKPAVLYSNNADDGPVIIEDLAIVTRNTEIINKRELMPETDNVVVDGRRPVEGFIDQDGNINIGTPPALSNSTHYPIYISKKVFAAAEGPNYQLVFDESIPPNLQRILKSTENEINNYNPPEIPQPSKSILEKIKDSLDEMFSSIGLGGSPSVNPDANTDIGSVRIDNGRMVTVLSNQNSNPGAKIEIFEFKPGDLVVEDGDAMPIPQSHINSEPVGYIVNNRTTGEKSLPIRLKANNRLIIPDGNQVDITFGQINQIGLFEEFKTNSPTININSDEINISMSTPLTSSLITKMTGTLEFAITGKTPVLPNYPLPSIGNEIKIIDINDSSLNLNPDIVNAIRWVNKQGIAVLSGPDLGKTNPEIFGGEYPAGGRAFPDKKMIAIKDNILQRGDPDAIAKIYHEAAGHIIGEQLPNNTVPNKIINELLAQRAASLMLIQQGVKADPTSFSNITGLVERYLKLTGKDPYQIIDAVIYKAYPDLQKPLK